MPATPQQRLRQARFETLLRLVAPVLDLVLSTGERVSRIVSPQDDDYYAIRPPGETFELGGIRGSGPGGRSVGHPES
jgi:hypothetical protein